MPPSNKEVYTVHTETAGGGGNAENPWLGSEDVLMAIKIAAPITFLDCKNTFTTKEGLRSLLQLLPASGGKSKEVAILLAYRSDRCLNDTVKRMSSFKKQPEMLALMGGVVATHNLAPGANPQSKGKPELTKDIEAWFEAQSERYDKRLRTRMATFDLKMAAQEADTINVTFALRESPFPLSFLTTLEIINEAQHGGLAPGLAAEIGMDGPSKNLVDRMAMLSALSVRPEGTSPWVNTHHKIEEVSKVVTDIDDIIDCLRHLYSSPPPPVRTEGPTETQAPPSSMSLVHQALWFTLLFTSEGDWPGGWFDTLSKDQLEARKTDKSAVPRGAGVAEFNSLQRDCEFRGAIVEIAVDMYFQRADLFAPIVPSQLTTTCTTIDQHRAVVYNLFENAAQKLPIVNIAMLHELMTTMSTELTKASDSHKASGNVEDLPMEVSVSKALPPSKVAIIVWCIYAAAEHDGGDSSNIFKNFSKFGREGAGGTSDSPIEKQLTSSRRGGLTDTEKAFHRELQQEQVQAMKDIAPDKTVMEEAFSAITQAMKGEVLDGNAVARRDPWQGDAQQQSIQFWVSQEEAIYKPVNWNVELLEDEDRQMLSQIRAKKRDAMRAAQEAQQPPSS